MAPGFMDTRAPRENGIDVEKLPSGSVDVFYVPTTEALFASGLDSRNVTEHRVKLLHFNGENASITIFPTYTNPGRNFLKPKYDKIERIVLADAVGPVPESRDEVRAVLQELPSGFTKDYEYGLGLPRAYRFIVYAVEELSDCTKIVISESSSTRIDDENGGFFIAKADFDAARKALDRITSNSQTAAKNVKDPTAYNTLAKKLGLPEKPVKVGKSPLRKLFTAVAQGQEPQLDAEEQELVLSVLTKNTKAIAETKPDELEKLKSVIECATLDRLINVYGDMINKNRNEDHWQKFFAENRFILNLAVGYPITIVRGQASVGGRTLCGSGDKIADFLVKNKVTNNAAIVEIKTPGTPLLNQKTYRSKVYKPSGDLSGSINQVLDQRYHFQSEFYSIVKNSKISDLESYSVHCCLIIGTTPTEENQRKSFEHCRGNSKDVRIVTFDELLENLRGLRDVLASKDTEPVA